MSISINPITFDMNSNISFKSRRKLNLLSKMTPHKKSLSPNNPKKYYFVLANLKKIDAFMTEKDVFHLSKSMIKSNPKEIKDLFHSLSLPNVEKVESPIIETSRGKRKHIGFTDGRHRFAVFRLKGFKNIMLTVDEKAKEIFEQIGAIVKSSEIVKKTRK